MRNTADDRWAGGQAGDDVATTDRHTGVPFDRGGERPFQCASATGQQVAFVVLRNQIDVGLHRQQILRDVEFATTVILEQSVGLGDLILEDLGAGGVHPVPKAELGYRAAIPSLVRGLDVGRRRRLVALDHGHVVTVVGQHRC